MSNVPAAEFVKALKAVQEDGGYSFCVRRYSGRGMFGRECVALELPRDCQLSMLLLGMLLLDALHSSWDADADPCDFEQLLYVESVDALGYDRVLYWPHAVWDDECTAALDA